MNPPDDRAAKDLANKTADQAAAALNKAKDQAATLANAQADQIALAANKTHDENLRNSKPPQDH